MAKIISSLPGSTGVLSKTSQLINDGETGISTYVELNDLSTVATTGDYNNLINIPIDFTPKVHTHNISDISGTKSEFNTSLTDGDFLFVGDVSNTPDATTTSKGVIKLAGDLAGTADAPTVPGLANKVDKVTGKSLIADSEITRLATVTNQDISGKANDSDVVHKSGNETITGVKSFQGAVPEIKLVETTNNNSVSLRSNSVGSSGFGFYGKTGKKLFSFVPGISGEAKMVIGDVDFPNDSQLLVYGGGGGANIDARGSNSADESNLDLENSDWLTNPKSIGLTTFGDNFNLGGDILGYERKKSSVLRFSNDKSFITSLAPIKLGINNLEIGNINSTGIEAISFTKSLAPTTNLLLAGGGDIAQSTFQPAITGLTTNYLPKWNGSGFGNSNIFDNGTNIGIGTTTPTFSKLQIKGDDGKFIGYFYNNSGTAGQVKGVVIEAGTNTYDFALLVNSSQGSPYFKVNGNGNSLFGNIQDNLVDRVQVAGTISASPATTANQVPTWGQVQAVARPYKVYTALLSQTGTNAPTIIVLENTLGATISMTRQSTGHYRTTISTGNFPANRTFKFIQNGNYTITKQQILTAAVQVNTVAFDMYTEVDGVKADDVLMNAAYEIRIYP